MGNNVVGIQTGAYPTSQSPQKKFKDGGVGSGLATTKNLTSRFKTDIKKSAAERSDQQNSIGIAAVEKQKESITSEFTN